MKKKFPAKISYGLLLMIFLVFFGPMFYGILVSGWSTDVIFPIAILTITFALVLHMFFATYYTVDGQVLHIKCSFIINKRIHINQINEVARTNSLLASPAPSFDRIEIKFNSDYIIISPKDKSGFLAALKEINPNIIGQL